MSEQRAPVVSLAELPLDSWERGTLYQSADISFGKLMGMRSLGISYSEVPPGKSSCPFHNHHVEDELFVILEGEGTYRFGTESFAFKAGSVLAAPAGGHETAHQIINTGQATLKYLGIANMSIADVCEYPDSGKFGVYSRTTGNPYDKSTLRHVTREGADVDYWDGEPGA
jgi:uncharacterized cupin superfamily protein